jgi:hypothetical protein
MQWVQRVVLTVAAAGIVAAAAPGARAQTDAFTAVPDSVVFFAPSYKFVPLYSNLINGDVSSLDMRNQFRTNVVTPYRLILDFDISKSEKHYRLSPGRRDENKRISLGSLYTIRPGLTGSFGVTDSRIFGRSAITGGAFQDFIIDDQIVSATLSHTGTIEPRYVYFMNFPRFTTSALRFDWRANASVGQGERTYKTDDTMGGSVGGGVAYNFGKRVVVQGRGALRQSNETSRTTLEEFNGLGASEDSLSGVVRVFLADSISIRGD